MRYLVSLLAFGFVSMLTGCPSIIIRDGQAYRLEALYFEKTIKETNKIVRHRLKTQCCIDGSFNTLDGYCVADGDVYAVTHSRAQHHIDRLMFLAGYKEIDPGDAPEVLTNKILKEICDDE
tara:strand:- start:370 stop:732 length:363 start_codon:yes stop_codon:yes gene_type:complete